MSFDLKIVKENTTDSFFILVENTTKLEIVKLKVSAQKEINYNEIILVLNGQPINNYHQTI